MATKNRYMAKNRTKKAGMPPGYLKSSSDRIAQVKITSTTYNNDAIKETEVKDIGSVPIGTRETFWINFDGIHDEKLIEQIGHKYRLHPLVLEDIMSTDQRPKLDDHEEQLFCTLRMMSIDATKGDIIHEQVSFVLGHNYLLSFQEKEGDTFEPTRKRLRAGKGRIRRSGPDYLMYTLIDTVVDNYFAILEKIGDRIELLEPQLLESPTTKHLQELNSLKNDLIFLRRSVWPLRELISKLEKDDIRTISKETKIYFRDIYDHCVQIIDIVETYRDLTSGLMDIYLSSINYKLNEVMKVLTIIATIFIPLTFLTGIYGMNFEYMPELRMKYAYPSLIVIMAVIISLQVRLYKRKKWL